MAGKQVVGEATIRMGTDNKGIEKGINEARSMLKKGMNALGTFLSAPAVGWNVGNQFVSFVQDYLKDAQNLERFAQMTDSSVDKMAAWATAADQYGAELSTLGDVFTNVGEKITAYANNKSGPIADLVGEELLADFNKDTAPKTLEFLEDLSEKLTELNSNQARVSLLKSLGINDPNVLAMMVHEGKSLKAIVRDIESQKTALYRSEHTASAKALSQALRDIAYAIKHYLMPALGDAVQVLAEFLKHIRALYPALGYLAFMLGVKAFSAIKKFRTAIDMLSVRKMGLFLALWTLGVLLDEFVGWANGADAVLADLFEALFGSREEAQNFIKTVYDWKEEIFLLIAALGAAKGAIVALGVAQKIVAGFSMLIGVVKSAAVAMRAFGIATYTALAPYLGIVLAIAGGLYLMYRYWDEICGIISKVVDWIGKAWDAFDEFCSSIWEVISSWWESKKGSFSLLDLFTFSLPGIPGILNGLKDIAIGPSGAEGAALAAAGAGNVNNNVEATQTIVQNLYGNNSKEAVANATAGATDSGLFSAVNSANYG